MERWATFDCYGTLVDWNAGIHDELEKLFGVELADRLLVRYHELEPRIQAENPGTSYREVLTIALESLAAETGLTLPEGETSGLARSLPEWPVFDDVHFGLSIVAGEIGSYKPAHRHWEIFRERVGGADAIRHVHVAQSLYHDIEPARELGIPSIWINRLDEPEDARPNVTLPGVRVLA